MINVSEIIDKVNSGEESIDSILDSHLYPGKALHDVDIKKLPIRVMDSGFPSLDDEYMILKEDEGELVIVGGRPSMGKSAWMFQVALHVSKTRPVHVFSLEMSQESIVRRLVSAMINKPITAIQRGLIDERIVQEAVNSLQKYKYHIDDQTRSLSQICDVARTRAKKYPTALIVIDYLQIIRGNKGHSRDAEVGEIAQELKALATDLKCPVLVGCQLNRQCEIRGGETGNYRPILSDLRESGIIEQAADAIVAIHRDYRYTKLRPDEADILILKSRNGPIGDTVMKFYAAQTKFEDMGDANI